MPRSPARLALGLTLLALSLTLAATPSRASAQEPVFALAAEGGGFVGDAQGAMGGVGARGGVAFGFFSIALQMQGFVGALTEGPNGGTLTGVLWNSAMLGLTFGPLQLGAGPSLDFGWSCDQVGCYRGTPLFGLDGRVALGFDHLVISVDVHPTWIDGDPIVGLVGGVGWQL